MGLGLIGLASEEEEDAKVSLRVQVLGFSRNHSGEFRDSKIGPLLAKVLIRLLLVSANPLRGGGAGGCLLQHEVEANLLKRSAGPNIRGAGVLCAYTWDEHRAQKARDL